MKKEEAKRVFDAIAAGTALALLGPVLLGISIWVKLDSRGPVIFRQRRLGLHGRVFEMYKFRSMVPNAEGMAAGLFNYENDPRVTRAGHILRASSLDELPQLLNVLKGDMSLVGPRPAVEWELGDYATLSRKYKKRFTVKPGITGLAQVKGRNENNWEEKVHYDNQYIDLFRKHGCIVDLKILAWTMKRVFERSNIYEKKMDDALSDAEAARLAQEEVIKKAHEGL